MYRPTQTLPKASAASIPQDPAYCNLTIDLIVIADQEDHLIHLLTTVLPQPLPQAPLLASCGIEAEAVRHRRQTKIRYIHWTHRKKADAQTLQNSPWKFNRRLGMKRAVCGGLCSGEIWWLNPALKNVHKSVKRAELMMSTFRKSPSKKGENSLKTGNP